MLLVASLDFTALRPVFYLAPRGEMWHPGVKLKPRGEHLCSPLRSFKQSVQPEGERKGEFSPKESKFTPGGQAHP
jgi:hypothetical protein